MSDWICNGCGKKCMVKMKYNDIPQLCVLYDEIEQGVYSNWKEVFITKLETPDSDDNPEFEDGG